MIPTTAEQWRPVFARMPDAELISTTRRFAELARVALDLVDERGIEADPNPTPAYRPGASGGLGIAPPARPILRVFAGPMGPDYGGAA